MRAKNEITDTNFFEKAFIESFRISYQIDPKCSDEECKIKLREILGVRDVSMYFTNPNHEIFILEEKSGEKIGLIWISIKTFNHNSQKQLVWVNNIYISQDFRRKKLAEKLLVKVEEWTKERGLKTIGLRVAVQNIAARTLCEKMGYISIEKEGINIIYQKEI